MASTAKHLSRIITRWPVDKLRPSASVQDALKKRIETIEAGRASPNEQAQVNALYSLLENRYQSKYPFPERILKPTSNPAYYDKLVAELDAVPERSWLMNKLASWRGFIRFS